MKTTELCNVPVTQFLLFFAFWLFFLVQPKDSAPGTIRGNFCVNMGRNVIHGSDSADVSFSRLWHLHRHSCRLFRIP